MNIFDMASILQDMVHDEDVRIIVNINGECEELIRRVEVCSGKITLHNSWKNAE